jgi:alanyl-tRNA synthetase
MAEQRTRAKADAKAKKGALADLSVYSDLRGQGETVFTGYDYLDTETRVLGILIDGQPVPRRRRRRHRRGHPRRVVAVPGIGWTGGRSGLDRR